ncbi:hypothetical protein ACFL54_00350 [Planctomycetota bacterium]
MEADGISELQERSITWIKDHPFPMLAMAAAVLVMGIIVVYEINQNLTLDERVLLDLSNAASLRDFDHLLEKYEGKEIEKLIALEKLIYLVNDDNNHTPDYEAAKAILDKMFDQENPDWINNDLVVVYANLLAPQVTANCRFERKLDEEKKNQPPD